jgi:hypothetical protein
MFSSVRRYRIGAGTAADAAKKVEDEFVPIISEIDGFGGYYVIDGGDGVLCSISVFNDQSGAQESDKKAGEWVPEGLKEFEPSDVEITEGEVLISKTA